MTTNQHFVFALVEDFTHIAFACAVDPLRIANLISGQQLYSWAYASYDGVWACSSDGTRVEVQHRFNDMPNCDRLFVLSGINMQFADHSFLLAALRRKDRHSSTQIGGLCSGSWILAQSGFLNGLKAAIHWEYHDSFMEEFPEVNLLRNVFVADEKYPTASGGTATADLMLHLIAQDHGHDLSIAIADQMVYNAVREASAAQKVSLQSRNGMRNKHLSAAIARMSESLDNPVSPSLIAREIGISTRQLERLFGKYLNASPKKYYMELRLERARHLLVQTEMSVIDVAVACGFQSPGHFSRVYRTAFGVTPMMQRGRLG
ncbi:GlxA family transcriptional regulator [Lentibacter algarum]|uniref:GlxA family transcriptional regulator n=1 Tax=Lentibacter algarum TaxID=576131 RepID=UPI001C06D735|nr:GlxA family transcriptional regulator [Lentibacter algarum]MBU2980220.1 GlxA family transcriptional regulator [Lentibacter algarum]